MKEIVPSVKYLKPLHEQFAAWHNLGGILGAGAPTLSASASTALTTKVIGSILNPLTGLALTLPSLMSMMAKLHINEIPPTDHFRWTVSKVTHHHPDFGLLPGVRWDISKKMFYE